GGVSSDAGAVFKLNPDGTGLALLQNFDYAANGANPHAALVQGTDGALYGTTFFGGSVNGGTIFKLNPDGSEFTVLKSLSPGVDLSEGGQPYAGLVQGTNVALYGTTNQGGISDYGTVFKLNPDGTSFIVLHSFSFDVPGGAFPLAGLIQAT